MLVSHRYKFIYTKTVKTASTSVESFFERFVCQRVNGNSWVMRFGIVICILMEESFCNND